MKNFIEIAGGYFDSASHTYKNLEHTVIPSVTQVMSGLGMVDYSAIREEILARKSAIGCAVHSGLQFLCEGTLDWDTVDPVALPYIIAGEMWMKDQGYVSLSQEGQGIHALNGMAYGFQFDQMGEMVFKGKHRKVILDWKTCVSASATWKLQTAAYALAAPPLPTGERYLRCILQLKADGKFVPYYFEDRSDETSWPHILFTYIWGLNNKLYTLERAA